MHELKSLFQAKSWLLNTFKGGILATYRDKVNGMYGNKTVGFIYAKKSVVFFMRFRRRHMTYDGGVIAFGCNKSELNAQLNGINIGDGRNVKTVWCLFVRPDKTVYVCNPSEIKMFLERHDHKGSMFRNDNMDGEDEPVINIPIDIMFEFREWLDGKTQSDYNWCDSNDKLLVTSKPTNSQKKLFMTSVRA